MHNIVVYIKQVTLCHKNSTHVNKEIMAMGKWRKLRCRLLPAALSVILMLPNRFMPTMAHRYMNTSSTNATLDTAGMDLGNWCVRYGSEKRILELRNTTQMQKVHEHQQHKRHVGHSRYGPGKLVCEVWQ